jgi:hypothetical protein
MYCGFSSVDAGPRVRLNAQRLRNSPPSIPTFEMGRYLPCPPWRTERRYGMFRDPVCVNIDLIAGEIYWPASCWRCCYFVRTSPSALCQRVGHRFCWNYVPWRPRCRCRRTISTITNPILILTTVRSAVLRPPAPFLISLLLSLPVKSLPRSLSLSNHYDSAYHFRAPISLADPLPSLELKSICWTRGFSMPRASAASIPVRGALAGAGEICEILDQPSHCSGRMPFNCPADIVGVRIMRLHTERRRGHGLLDGARVASEP